MSLKHLPPCGFCGEPAAENKGQPGKYRKYCGDLCMSLNGSLKPVLTDATDRVGIKQCAEIIFDARLMMGYLIRSAQPPDPRYHSGYKADAGVAVQRAVSMVEGLASA
jgi:hypothetical protein